MTEPIKLEVAASDAGRIDKAIARHFPEAGRRQLAAMFEDGAVRLRGKRARKGDPVAAGDVIELAHAPVAASAARPVADPDAGARLGVLLECAELVVVDKPAGMPSQPLAVGELGTAASGIAARWPECAAIGDDPRDGGLVHRLDIGTSGALIAARSPEIYRALRDAFGAGLVEKQYLAITVGLPVSRESDAPLEQRGRKVAVDYTSGQPALTTFTVERAGETHALVRCVAHTGRMHQVRAHLAHVNAPIAGDTLYGGAAIPGDSGFFLHAARIAFPLGDQQIVVESPLPARFVAALASVGL
jgi:23S rRNA pseudouridine1911/1915/1917 synthase